MPGLNDPRVDPAQVERATLGRVDEHERLEPEAGAELLAARVRLVRHLEHRRPDRELRARREVLAAQIEIDVELVTRERPALPVARHERRRPRVHDRDLRLRVRGTPARAAARLPVVADEPVLDVELGLVDDLALVDRRPAHDQLHDTLAPWGRAQVVEPRLELLR